jgi:hypothetical protein
MQKVLGMLLVVAGLCSVACASIAVPEIDGSTAASALTLLTGAALVIRARK